MKYIILIFISLFLVSCFSPTAWKIIDKRCEAILDKASEVADKERVEKGSCEQVIVPGKLADGSPHVACKVMVEASKKCSELPYDPNYVSVTDPGVKLDKKGNPISIDEKPFRIKKTTKDKKTPTLKK